jgi:ADP-heptose:LPS heptosyltransferase
VARCFLFKPDGIGDFFLSSGVIRFLALEFGEDNLVIAVLPLLEPVVRGQFPGATVIPLPIRKKRVILNVFVANCLRCFLPWILMLRSRVDVAISLRHMRDYLMNVLFYSVPARRRFVIGNLLLGNGRPVRRWTERAFTSLFHPIEIAYPHSSPGVPRELEANRLLLGRALGRDVEIREIWPELHPVTRPARQAPYWVCAPFSSDPEKDYPIERWSELFLRIAREGGLPTLLLTGSPDQKERLEAFRDRLVEVLPESAAGGVGIQLPPDLQQFVDFLACASLVLTVDTAAAHAATALDRPAAILFSGQHHGTYAPWIRSARQQWLYPGIPPEGTRWSAQLSDEKIAGAVREVLSSGD